MLSLSLTIVFGSPQSPLKKRKNKNSSVSSKSQDTDKDGILNNADVDKDNDGLIEISSLLMLHNIRYNIAGTHYSDNTTSTDAGCPLTKCNGYELTEDFDFDRDGDGTTFLEDSIKKCNVILKNLKNTSRKDFSKCKIDKGDVHPIYFPADDGSDSKINEGWLPINNFSGIFEGNGHIIKNLYINREKVAGLFHWAAETAII